MVDTEDGACAYESADQKSQKEFGVYFTHTESFLGCGGGRGDTVHAGDRGSVDSQLGVADSRSESECRRGATMPHKAARWSRGELAGKGKRRSCRCRFAVPFDPPNAAFDCGSAGPGGFCEVASRLRRL